MADGLKDYWQRIDPVLKRPEEGGGPVAELDFHRAWDRLARQLWTVLPRQLDRAKGFRNLYDNAVKL